MKFLKQFKARAMVVFVRILHADQIVLVETVVDLDVELVVVALVRARSKPVVVNASARDVRFAEKSFNMFCATGSIRLPGTGWAG